MSKEKVMKVVSLSLPLFIGISTLFITVIKTARAQNWAALPPYNTLWPLWSQALSPIDASTGLPTPLVTSLTPSTVLPVQPGLTWDPARRNPWLLYNTPLGMAYYDPLTGVDLWPPEILINQITGLPISLTLPADYSALPPTLASWLLVNVPAANWTYLATYPTYTSRTSTLPWPTLNSLLTPAALLL